ncbi:MAG: hypothetical protein ACXW1Z_25105, partial [Methylobacter sp.]
AGGHQPMASGKCMSLRGSSVGCIMLFQFALEFVEIMGFCHFACLTVNVLPTVKDFSIHPSTSSGRTEKPQVYS